MKHTFTREQIKTIIVEELEKSKVAAAAEEIVDELESILTEADESALKKIYNKIFAKSKKENIDADKLAIQTWKTSQKRRRAK